MYSDLKMSCVTLTFELWTRVKDTAHCLNERTFVPSCMVNHHCISKLYEHVYSDLDL